MSYNPKNALILREAQNLACGDRFKFREQLFVCLMSFTDTRHSQTVVSAVRWQDWQRGGLPRPVAFRLLREFRVEIIGQSPMTLEKFENTDEEVKHEARNHLSSLIGEHR